MPGIGLPRPKSLSQEGIVLAGHDVRDRACFGREIEPNLSNVGQNGRLFAANEARDVPRFWYGTFAPELSDHLCRLDDPRFVELALERAYEIHEMAIPGDAGIEVRAERSVNERIDNATPTNNLLEIEVLIEQGQDILRS